MTATAALDIILVVIDEQGHACETAAPAAVRPLVREAGSEGLSDRGLDAGATDARNIVIDVDEDGMVDDSQILDGCALVVLDLGLVGLRLAEGVSPADIAHMAACPEGASAYVAERCAFWRGEIAAGREPRSW
jgi:hypothetical protein